MDALLNTHDVPDQETLDAVRSVATEALDRAAARPDDDHWSALAAAGLLALPVPTEHGGEGLGLAGAVVLLREASRRALSLPLWETLCCGALTLARAGTAEQQAAWLPGVARGEVLLAPALREPGRGLLDAPATRLHGGAVTGRKIAVRRAEGAARLLVTAIDDDGASQAVLVDPSGPGVTLLASPTSAGTRGAPEHTVVLEGAPAELLDDAHGVLVEHAVAGLAVEVAGLVAGARDLTAGYVKGRTQFGRALAEFQAVSLQAADVYIASRTLDLVADNAVWRVARGLPADDDLRVAAYWAGVEAPPAARTCHHLHGGMGVDLTYPLPTYSALLTDVVRALELPADQVPVEDPTTKNLELSAEQRALKAELRSYFTGLAGQAGHGDPGPEGSRDRHGESYQQVIRQMGRDGWMGVGWPREYGGHGLGELEQTVFANEAQWADVHLPAVTLQTVGPTLIRYGTQKQKDLFLERILRGEVHFAIGYSEPDAGTDLAALRTTARRDGDHYVVNGQKLWTTGGHQADYVWLAVRTDPDAPKHRGISILIVDTSDPGYSWTPIITADGSHHVNATYFNDVRVPVDMLVGEENQGWKLITTQLNHERVMLGPAGRIEGLRDKVLDWATKAGVAESPDVREVMGRVTATFRVNELLNWEVARAGEHGEVSVGDASSSKVFASDRIQSIGPELAGIVHRHGDPADAETAELLTYLDGQFKRNLVLTFGGGVQEVQRELIAMFGLGMPRVPR